MSKICKECGNKIRFDEYSYNGKCKQCYEKNLKVNNVEENIISKEDDSNINQNDDIIYTSRNIVASIIKIISIICGIIGTFYGLSMSDNFKTEEYTFPIIIGSIVISIFIYGFGEIIQILEDIKNK